MLSDPKHHCFVPSVSKLVSMLSYYGCLPFSRCSKPHNSDTLHGRGPIDFELCCHHRSGRRQDKTPGHSELEACQPSRHCAEVGINDGKWRFLLTDASTIAAYKFNSDCLLLLLKTAYCCQWDALTYKTLYSWYTVPQVITGRKFIIYKWI